MKSSHSALILIVTYAVGAAEREAIVDRQEEDEDGEGQKSNPTNSTKSSSISLN